MNDTILNQRQRKILELLQTNGKMSRTVILGSLKSLSYKNVSRITIIRDLHQLIDLGLVEQKGKARATIYAIRQKHSLLQYVDMGAYFGHEMDDREAKNSFNEGIFSQLKGLYDTGEKDIWERSADEFKKRRRELNPTIYKREFERFIIELSWKSSQIEGNTYDLLETETLIKHKIEARGHTKAEAIMILNHKKAFDKILKNTKNFKHLTYSTVLQLHNLLVKDLGISAGVRKNPVRITGTAYISSHKQDVLWKLLGKVIDKINKTAYPPEKALIAVCMIAYLQPFADGNKRTARMLSNALLLAYNYFPLSYRNVDVTEYQKATILFYEQNNLYNFKKIFLDQLRFAMNNYFLI